MTVDLEREAGAVDESVEMAIVASEGPIPEPYVGMEFDSEDAARKYYTDYARQVGFVVRVMQRRRSGIDGRTLARRLGCNKQGFSPNQKGKFGPEKKPRPSAREGCNATILVKMEKSGKWVVTRFVQDHNHPLVVTASGFSTAVSLFKIFNCFNNLLLYSSHLIEFSRSLFFAFDFCPFFATSKPGSLILRCIISC